ASGASMEIARTAGHWTGRKSWAPRSASDKPRHDMKQQQWVRFQHDGRARFGTLDGSVIDEHEGDMFARSRPTGRSHSLADIELLTPTTPSKVIALWNNFHALAEKLELAAPAEPLYLLKAPNSYLAANQTIRNPACKAKVVFEG